MITNRDRKILDFLEQYNIAKTSTLATFYPNLLIAQKRLKILHDSKIIKRQRDYIGQEFMYYIHKPKQIQHDVLLTDFYYKAIKMGCNIRYFKKEYSIGNVRADGLIAYTLSGKKYVAFIEIQRGTKPLDITKYKRLKATGECDKEFGAFPLLFFITNQKVKTDLDCIVFNENMEVF